VWRELCRLERAMGESIDHFEVLGLPRGAALDEEVLRLAFQARGRVTHPDAGGAGEVFESVNRAYVVLGDPASRLRHLCELEFGAGPDATGAVDAATMGLFEAVGAAIAGADAYLRRLEAAGSAVAKALLAAEGVEVQRAVMAAGGQVRARREEVLARLPGIDRELRGDRDLARQGIGECYRALGFLGKWGVQVGERMVALI